MAKTQEVQMQMMSALKAGDKPRKNALSLLLAALKNKQIDKRAPLTAAEEDAVILREIKEAQETIDTTPADRTAVIEECRARIAVYRRVSINIQRQQIADEPSLGKVVCAVCPCKLL